VDARLVIFDCDGVLVDSESISLCVLLEVLAEAGCRLTEAEGYDRLLGRSIGAVAEILAETHDLTLTGAHLAEMRSRLYRRFREELQPIPGVAGAIRAILEAGTSVCVASSSQPERIRLSLEVTGLAPLFGEAIFSASEVARGKPAPDLFLHAAAGMHAPPEACVVVEDSPAGIEAAHAAGMGVIAFTGGSHAGPARLVETAARLRPDAAVASMSDLVPTLAKL
jgi:HAD superfamily hydrolase (TIGR01509 family)